MTRLAASFQSRAIQRFANLSIEPRLPMVLCMKLRRPRLRLYCVTKSEGAVPGGRMSETAQIILAMAALLISLKGIIWVIRCPKDSPNYRLPTLTLPWVRERSE